MLNRPERRARRSSWRGDNFGCGSSREHAPWALLGYGFRAVISTAFADIFRNNALKNGLVAITVDEAAHETLVATYGRDPRARVTIDLPAQRIQIPKGSSVPFSIDPFAKHCLEHGIDALGFILAEQDRITEFERAHPARVQTV